MLVPCTSCGRHILDGEASCPHCTIPRGPTTARTVAAVALGLGLLGQNGCFVVKGSTEVDYGTSGSWTESDTDTDTDTDTDADTDADTDTDTDTDTDADTDTDSGLPTDDSGLPTDDTGY